MRTSVPGPRSIELKKELNTMQEMSSVSFFADYEASYGDVILTKPLALTCPFSR